MRLILAFAIVSMLAFLPGCGEKPAGDLGADSTAVEGNVVEPSFDFQTPALEVGQWIAYGADADSLEVKFSVVAEEVLQGENCLWVQFEANDEVVQVLINPALLTAALENYSQMANDFIADPAAYIEANMAQGTDQILTTEESLQSFMAFLRAIKMMKVTENGTVMAYDLTNVPGVIEPLLQDSAFLAQIQAGVQLNMNGADNQQMADSLADKIAEYDFSAEVVEMDIAGTAVSGSRFMAVGPEIDAEIFFSTDLPILPFGFARVKNIETAEEHTVTVRGFGNSGAENLMPEPPAQVIDIAPMIQMMITQMQSQAAQQTR